MSLDYFTQRRVEKQIANRTDPNDVLLLRRYEVETLLKEAKAAAELRHEVLSVEEDGRSVETKDGGRIWGFSYGYQGAWARLVRRIHEGKL